MADDKTPLSDDGLDGEEQANGKRKGKILDAVVEVAVIAIYVIPIALGFMYLAVLAHQMFIGEWTALEATLQGMVIPVATYLAGLLQSRVFKG